MTTPNQPPPGDPEPLEPTAAAVYHEVQAAQLDDDELSFFIAGMCAMNPHSARYALQTIQNGRATRG